MFQTESESIVSTLNPAFSEVLELVEQTGKNVFLTGRAGTGKTSFLHLLKERAVKRMVVLAPTGIAAIHAGGTTIHSFFQLPLGLFLPGYVRRGRFRFGKEKIELLRCLDLLVIDEASMLRADLLDEVSRVLQRYRASSKPFGGVQLLLIGDLHQLSPIVKEEEWEQMSSYYASPYFFDSIALKAAGFESVELTEIFRQSDTAFIGLLEKIRLCQLDPASLDTLSSRYRPDFEPSPEEGYVTLTTHNFQSERINQEKLESLPGEAVVYEASVIGIFPESSYPTASSLALKPGAQVMFIKNDLSVERRYYNGKIGRISSCREESVIVESDGEEIEVMPDIWENKRYVVDAHTKEIREEVDGVFRQFPIKLAWAITIHKSQGLTFDKVVVDAGLSFAPGQVYVALSRCRSMDGLVLRSPLKKESLMEDVRISDFSRGRSFSIKAEELQRLKEDYYFELLREQFDFTTLWKQLNMLQDFAYHSIRSVYSRLYADLVAAVGDFGSSVYQVSEKFSKELYRLREQPESYRNERCVKASLYFLSRIEENLQPLLLRLTVELDNRSSADMLSRIRHEIKRIVSEKKRTFSVLSKRGMFEGSVYLRLKSGTETVGNGTENDSDMREESRGTRSSFPKRASAGRASRIRDSFQKTEPVREPDIRHPELVEALQQWRRRQCREEGKAAYMVLSQKALIGVASALPRTTKELLAVSGIGEKKVSSYGEALLEIVRAYCRSSDAGSHPGSDVGSDRG